MSTAEVALPTGTIAKEPPANGNSKPSVREVELEKELTTARQRIGELESQVVSLQTQLSASNKRKTEASSAPASSKKAKILTPVTPAPVSTKLVSKRLQQTIKNSLKGVKFFNGYDVTDRHVNVNDVLSVQEFESMFGNYGTLIQPTPSNKPKSTVYIRELSAQDMQDILGVSSFKAELWTKGGVPTYGGGYGWFGRGGSGFSKGQKIKGGCQVILQSAEAKYSSNNGKLLLKCTFCNKKMFNEVDSDDEGYY